MASLWMPGAERRPGPSTKVGYSGQVSGPKRGDVKHSAEGFAGGLLTVLHGSRRASWQFSVLKDGTIWQHYELDAHCWHAGSAAANVEYVGIEHEGVAGEPLTEAQIKSTVEISQYCAVHFGRASEYARFPVLPERGWTMAEHNQVSDSPTACPSNRIPWTRVLADLKPPEPEPEDDMTTYTLAFQAQPFPLTFIIAWVEGVPIYKRYLQFGATVGHLRKTLGEPKVFSADELRKVPSIA